MSVSSAVILTGVGVYTGSDAEIADESLHVTFDRTTDSVRVVNSESAEEVASAQSTMTTAEARAALKFEGHIPCTCDIWFGRQGTYYVSNCRESCAPSSSIKYVPVNLYVLPTAKP